MTAVRVKNVFYISMLALTATISLQGCPLIIAGAAGGGAMIVSDRRTFGAQTEDREIQIKAASQFSRQLPKEAHLNIAVFNRHVLLTGEVPSQTTKQRAEALLRNVLNVRSVVNELAVQGASSLPSRSNDAYLTAKVKTALIREEKLSANFLKVVTERGVVYLMGLVSVTEGNLASDVTSRVPGVLQVVKVFQYIQPQQAQQRAAMISSQAASGDPETSTTTSSSADVQTGVVSPTAITAQPLEQQAPAPIKNSTPQ